MKKQVYVAPKARFVALKPEEKATSCSKHDATVCIPPIAAQS